jgi:3-hydroxyisobutyrate dehydrogenase-like beta-hydroxyacid dehydrogenase
MPMARCEVCGNDYDKTFEILLGGRSHIFDSFECAIAALAPRCTHCGCRVIGHGMEKDDQIYCCAHCASAAGATQMVDRV